MDRRTLWAILLMMVIAVAPAIFLKKPVPTGKGSSPRASGAAVPSGGSPSVPSSPDTSSAARLTADTVQRTTAAPTSSRTVHVTSPLYEYGVSATGARL